MRRPSPLLPFSGMQNSKRRMKFSNSFSVQRLPPDPLPGWQARTFISFISPVPAILTLIVSTP